jgi:hypothetical protein
MSKSPLANSFNSKSKKRSKPILILALLGILGLGGGVLASQISINTDETVEFGQGAADVITCDQSIQIYPTSVYLPLTNTFKLGTIEIRDLDTRTTTTDVNGLGVSDAGCAGRVLTVKALREIGEPYVWITVVPTRSIISDSLTLSPSPSQTIISHDIEDITIESNDQD